MFQWRRNMLTRTKRNEKEAPDPGKGSDQQKISFTFSHLSHFLFKFVSFAFCHLYFNGVPLSFASILYSNHSFPALALFLMSSALFKMEKSPLSVGWFLFLSLTLFAFHVFVWLVTNSVHPPPSRVISQWVFTGPFRSGLIVYTPSGNWMPVSFPSEERCWQEWTSEQKKNKKTKKKNKKTIRTC